MPALLRVAALALVTTLLAGCGTNLPFDDDGSARARAASILDDVREAVEQAKDRRSEQTGEVDRTEPEGGRQIRTQAGEFDYEEYTLTLQAVFASLESYWSQALPALGVPFRAPRAYTYYRPEEAPGPRCGEQEAPAKNAFYCPAGDFIAWDESGLVIPYYVQSGDFAAAFVLAHEFGHAMQARLPRKEQLTVLSELQADCFAGAWSRQAQEEGQLEGGDLDEAAFAVLSAGDVPGTAFTDPRAHGTGFERTAAYLDGYFDGPRACYPAPAQEWVIDER